jgi:HEAT repeat protein
VKAEAVKTQTLILAAKRVPSAYAALITSLGSPAGDSASQAAIQLVVRGREDPRGVLSALLTGFDASKDPRQRHGIAMCIGIVSAGPNPQQEQLAKLSKVIKVTSIKVHPPMKEGIPALLRGLADSDQYVREVSAQGLGWIGDQQSAPALGKALSDPVAGVRRRAASALVNVPAKAAQPQLEAAALKDSDGDVRRFAVEALGWIGDDTVAPALIAATRDREARVRRFAAIELGRRKAGQAVDALLTLFRDKDPDVRWQAVLAVGELRDPRATEALVHALDDPAAQVATAAERALQRLGIASTREKYLEKS